MGDYAPHSYIKPSEMKIINLLLKIIAITLMYIVYCPAFATIQVPKGFEEFSRGEDDVLLVSIYGKELGLFKVHVDLEKVTFLEPNKLADAVKDKFNSSEKLQQVIHERLKSSLNRNKKLSCSNNSTENCNFIKTDSVSIIYDENNAAILLFFHLNLRQLVRRKNVITRQRKIRIMHLFISSL